MSGNGGDLLASAGEVSPDLRAMKLSTADDSGPGVAPPGGGGMADFVRQQQEAEREKAAVDDKLRRLAEAARAVMSERVEAEWTPVAAALPGLGFDGATKVLNRFLAEFESELLASGHPRLEQARGELAKRTAAAVPGRGSPEPADSGDPLLPERPIAATESLPEGLSQGQISAVIKQNRTSLTSCYQRQLKRDDSFANARATLRFRVFGDGKARDVTIEKKFDGTLLRQCLVQSVERLAFPPFDGDPIPIEFPLIFQAAL